MRTLTLIMASLLMLGALPTTTQAGIHLTTGKYSRYQLWSQISECYDWTCQGCMEHWFPDPGNPFDSRNTENCEGINPFINGFYYWGSKLTNSDWVQFALFTNQSTLFQTVATCGQRYRIDSQCYILGEDISYDVWGAYLVGSDLFMPTLTDYIDRGFDRGAAEAIDYDWAPYRAWVEYAVDDIALSSWLPFNMRWGVAFYASLLYWSELTTADPAMRASRAAEEEFVLKCMAHSLVCWQSEYWENGRSLIDLLGPNNIDDWRLDPAETPGFVYTMFANLNDLIGIDTITRKTSWSAVKGMYR